MERLTKDEIRLKIKTLIESRLSPEELKEYNDLQTLLAVEFHTEKTKIEFNVMNYIAGLCKGKTSNEILKIHNEAIDLFK